MDTRESDYTYENYDPLKCRDCNLTFKDSKILQRHYLTDKHKRNSKEGGYYKCEFCNHYYTTAKLCANHSRNCNAKYNKNNNKLVKYMEEIKTLKQQNKRLSDELQFTKDRLIKTEYLLEQIILKSVPNEPQNIVITNNNASESDETKKINITKKNFEKKLPDLITEPKSLKDIEKAWEDYFTNNLKVNASDDMDSLSKRFNDMFNKFLDNYEKEEMFCYVSSKRNKPSTIYYYDTDSWIMGSYEDLENAFINSYCRRQLTLFQELGLEKGQQDLYCELVGIYMKFKENVNTTLFYKSLYHKLI